VPGLVTFYDIQPRDGVGPEPARADETSDEATEAEVGLAIWAAIKSTYRYTAGSETTSQVGRCADMPW